MTDSRLQIGIIGAGTSGVYLAGLLAQDGHDVKIFERGLQARTEGCGILLVSAGMKALHQGNPEVCRQILRAGVPAQTFEFRNLRDQVANSHSESPTASELPGVLVHRGAILQALLATLPPHCLHVNAQLASVSQTAESVIAHFADGTTWQGDLLVGADGIFSTVRDVVHPGVQPVYLGDIVWRGIVADREFCPDGMFKVYMRGRGIYTNFFDIGNGYTHWGFFIEKEQAPAEVSRLQPYETAIPAAELAKLPEAPRSVIESTPTEQIKCRFSYDIDPLPRLYAGRVVLIGDAAHAKSPTRARGMTAGLEDALALSRHLASGGAVQEVLAAFEAERLPIVHDYQRTSRELSQRIGRARRTKRAA